MYLIDELLLCYYLKLNQNINPQLKSFLVFLHMLPEHELQEIDDDAKITEVLRKL